MQRFLFILQQTHEKIFLIYFIGVQGGGFLVAFVRRENIICATNSKTNDFRGKGTNSASRWDQAGTDKFFPVVTPSVTDANFKQSEWFKSYLSVRQCWQHRYG